MAVPNLWRTQKQRYQLQGEVCPACSNTIFPPKRVCPHCHHGAITSSVAGQQEIYNYVMVFDMPQNAEFSAVGDD